jgi:hypothetical protein
MNEQLTKLLVDFELLDKDGEANASVSSNPNVSWIKYVFTDDIPNVNKQKIPGDEFPNVTRTGLLMPIKMATGKINDGHEEAVPLGVISHLKEDGNKVIGLAALWTTEREDDVKFLKERNANGTAPQLSWELYYKEATVDEEGISTLHGVVVKAITIVNMPAYQGRTPILAMANEHTSESASMEDKVTEEELKAKIAELEAKVATLTAELSAKDETVKGQTEELSSLKEFKASVEKKELEAQKFAEIKTLFKEAGVEKDEAYFETNKEKLLKMEKEDMSFWLQEAIAFSTSKTTSTEASVKIPPLPASNSSDLKDPAKLAKALRELQTKK